MDGPSTLRPRAVLLLESSLQTFCRAKSFYLRVVITDGVAHLSAPAVRPPDQHHIDLADFRPQWRGSFHCNTGSFGLGATGFEVAVIAGVGETIAASLRFFSGRFTDRSRAYWTITFCGYAMNVIAVPALGYTNTLR
jgi:hypothetical protein